MGKEYSLKIVGSDKLFVRQYEDIIEAAPKTPVTYRKDKSPS